MNTKSPVGGRKVSRRSAIRSGVLAGAGLSGAVLIGCGDESEPTSTPTAPAATGGVTSTPSPTAGTPTDPGPEGPRAGGVLGLSAPVAADNFNPVVHAAEANQLSAQQVYDTLLLSRSHDDRIYELMAAESVEMVDEVTAVFTLKPGLVYQDREPVNGRAVVADDIVTMKEYVRDEERALQATFERLSLASIDAPDDRTVVFHLNQPNAYLFTGAALGLPHTNGIIPSELVLGNLDSMEPVGSGPYQLASFQFGVRYEYERNPTYRGAAEGLPLIDQRVRICLADASALEAAFRSEQINVWVPPAEIADRLEGDLADEIDVREFLAPNMFMWTMSSEREWSADARVREAFYRAFSAQEMIDLVVDGWGVPTPGKLTWAMVAYRIEESDVADLIRHDQEAARQLLDAAGFDLEQSYEITSIAGPVNESAVQVFQEQIRRVGVGNTTIHTSPAGEWLPTKSGTGDYDFVGGVGFPGWDGPGQNLRMNHTEPAQIHRGWNIKDPEIDQLIEQTEVLTDREEHVELVKNLQLELTRRFAHLSHAYTPVNREIVHSYVRDWETYPWSVVMHQTGAWLDR